MLLLRSVGEGREFVEPALAAAGVVEMDVVADGLGEAVVIVKLTEVVHLALEGAPEGFHGGVVHASAGAGHALDHALLAQLELEFQVGVLKAAVAVHEGMGVGIFFDGAVEGGEHEVVVVTRADIEGDDVVGHEVEYGGEIEFAARSVFHFGDVGEPFFVWGLGGKIMRKNVGRQLHKGRGVRCGLLGADDGAKVGDLGQTMETFFVVVGVVDGVVFVGESAIAVDAAIGLVEMAHFVEDVSVFALAGGWGAVEPMVISGAADGKCLTDPGDGVTELRHILDDDIFQFMAHAGQSHLLSRSRSFLTRALLSRGG